MAMLALGSVTVDLERYVTLKPWLAMGSRLGGFGLKVLIEVIHARDCDMPIYSGVL